MSSESGLKQRKTHVQESSNRYHSSEHDHHNSDNNSDSERINDKDNEEFDADSKETRLTLMEEILLLGLKDREVIQQQSRTTYRIAVKS